MTQPATLGASFDRLKGGLDALFRLMLPQLIYMGQWTARVLIATPASPVATVGPAVYATPATVNCALTDLAAIEAFGTDLSNLAIPIWADSAGLVCVPAVGSLVRIGFANYSAQWPYIAGLDPQNLPALSVGVALRAFATASTDPAAAALLTAMGVLG